MRGKTLRQTWIIGYIGINNMSGQEIQSDAQFYNLIYQLASTEQAAERRGFGRHPFLCKQRIAPWPESGKLAQADFMEVRCHDLNQAGFSFLLPVRPQFTSVVAALNSGSEEIYIIARITRCEEMLVYPSGLVEPVAGRSSHVSYREPGGGVAERLYQVGCRFMGRIARPD